VLAPFEPLEDCFRYDDQNAEQAGLSAESQIGVDGETTYTLKAIRHLACIGASAGDVGAGSLYELSMQARSVAVRNPKFCLYLRGPDLCRTLPPVALYQGWTRYETLIPPDPDAVETRLYLYGMRDLKEQQQSQVEYRGVRLRPVASPSSIVLVRQQTYPGRSAVDWQQKNPAQFTGTVVARGRTVVALAESAAPGWVLTGVDGARKVTLQGWMGGWLLPSGGEVTIRYTPARVARAAYYLLPVAVLGSLVFMWLTRVPPGRPGGWIARHRRRRLRWRR
jgi:arabinofuranan 3-O-arabinosyltransferase